MTKQFVVEELKPFGSIAYFRSKGMDEAKLIKLGHNDDFYKVGFFTEGGQRRFITHKLLKYLEDETKRRI